MKKTFKLLLFGSLPFLLILYLLFFFNIIKSDWNYAHKSMYTYQYPFNWFSYKIKSNIAKSFINFKEISGRGLDVKRIYIEERKKKNLLIDTPISTKIWQRGFHMDEDDKLKEAQIRFRGDNPRNWLLEKKHWRIKVNKNEIKNQKRYFDFLPFKFDKYFSGKIANSVNLISPEFKLIELYVNDLSEGVYIESENLNESFLRRKKIMPVNMYKIEQILDESITALDINFFNSPGATSKSAIFNQLDKSDKSDLIFYLELIRQSQNDKKSFKNLIDTIGIDNWALFTAYQILTQNFHNDNSHNGRFVVDPWSGYLIPIVYDPLIGSLDKTNFNLNLSSNDLISLLNKSSEFQHLKLEKLNKILDTNVVEKLISEHNDIEDNLMISEKRDIDFWVENFNLFKLVKIIFDSDFVDDKKKAERKKFLDNYKDFLNNLNLYLKSKPKGNWKKNKYGFEILVQKDLPLSNLKVYFKDDPPKWLYIDLNENNFLDDNEKQFKFYSDNGYFDMNYNFYANRLDHRNSISYNSNVDLITPDTRFKFISENSSKPYKITYENPFSKNEYLLEENNFNGVPLSQLNFPVTKNHKKVKTIKLSGNYQVTENKVFNENVTIEAGTIFNLHKKKSLIFKKKVKMNGSKTSPIVFQKATSENWGTIALQGEKTDGSILKNIIIDGGSGFNKNDISEKNFDYYSVGAVSYISALSLHKTKKIKLKNILIKNNLFYDDALHIIYSDNIDIENLEVIEAFGDAIDIDMSNRIFLKNLKINGSFNDAIDLMESSVFLDKGNLYGSKDKGISVGENSYLVLKNSELENNNIGIATKDGSLTEIFNSNFLDNEFHIKNYKKNWRYGDGGITVINDSSLVSKKSKLKNLNSGIDNFSSLILNNTKFEDQILNKEFYSEINMKNHINKIKLLN